MVETAVPLLASILDCFFQFFWKARPVEVVDGAARCAASSGSIFSDWCTADLVFSTLNLIGLVLLSLFEPSL